MSHSPDRRRPGLSSLEVVFVAVLLGIALVPLSELLQTSRRASRFSEAQVVAQRQAQRVLAVVAQRPFPDLVREAYPPPEGVPEDPRLAPDSLELGLPVRVGEDVLLDALDPVDAEVAVGRLGRTRVFLTRESESLARVSAYVWWPAGAGRRRALVVSRLVEDPFRPRGEG